MCCAAAVLAVALLCGLYSYPKWCGQARRHFEERAGAALQFTKAALIQDEDKHPKELLRKFFQLETKRGHFDQLALVVGRRVAISHSLDWEGLELNVLLGQPDRSIAHFLEETPGRISVRTNDDLHKFEAVVRLPYGDEHRPVVLYMSLDSAAMNRTAWSRFGALLRFGSLLAAITGGATYLTFRRHMVIPLAKLHSRINKRGLGRKMRSEGLGELVGLVEALESASGWLLQQESERYEQLQSKLHKSEEQTAAETDLLRCLGQDLRSSMSAIMGYSELLLTCGSDPSDRINHIRAIQQEARRIAHLAREIQELPALRSASESNSDSDAPLDKLRSLVEEIATAQSAELQISPAGSRRTKLDAREEQPDETSNDSPAQPHEPRCKTRLSGSILIFGRKDEVADTLLAELHELGLGAVLVPDRPALESELSKSDYELVMVNLSRGDRAAVEMSGAVRAHFADGPVVAVLPRSARGEGNKWTGLGFDDYLYAPTSRQNILAVIGKYLGFEPVAAPALAQAAD